MTHSIDREAIYQTIRTIHECGGSSLTMPIDSLRTLSDAARAFLDSTRSTKTVEVWIIHFSTRRTPLAVWEVEAMPMTEGEAETRKEAALMADDPAYACVNVSGPYTQEVPEL